MMRPTAKTALLFAVSIPLALIVVVAWRDYWYCALYLPCLTLAAALLDATMTIPRRRLAAETEAPRRLYIGERGRMRVALSCGDWPRRVSVWAILELEGDADEPAVVEGALEDGRLEFELDIVPHRRGQLKPIALWLRWRGPLGLVEQRIRRPLDDVIDVVPNVRGIHEEALNFFANDWSYGVKSQRMRGEGSEFDKLCEYSQGMDNRFIDWKRSARHRKLLAKEFRQERNHQIILGFDTGHLMLEPLNGVPRLDHAIRAGLVLGWISLYGGDLVGGCGFDVRFRSFIQPGRGMPYFTHVQRFAAALDYRTEETNFTLGLMELGARLKRRGLVVLFSEFVDTISAELLLESLQQLQRKHVVVFVTMRDPMLAGLTEAEPRRFTAAAEAVIADDFLRERSIVLERMSRMGIHCLDVPEQLVSSALLNRYLMIKQRGLL